MARIVLSEVAQYGVKGAKKRKLKSGKKYKTLVHEADKKIDEERLRYARAYKKASTYLAR